MPIHNCGSNGKGKLFLKKREMERAKKPGPIPGENKKQKP